MCLSPGPMEAMYGWKQRVLDTREGRCVGGGICIWQIKQG